MEEAEKLDFMKRALVRKIMACSSLAEAQALILRLRNGEAKAVILEELTAHRDQFSAAIDAISQER